MKLYLLSQEENNDWDTYDSFVVACEDIETARHTLPSTQLTWGQEYSSWCKTPDAVTVKYLGEAADGIQGIICASFNAG